MIKTPKSIDEMFMDEYHQRIQGFLKEDTDRITTIYLDPVDYAKTLGRIEALRLCTEELKTLVKQFFPR